MIQDGFISEFENENFEFCGINWWPFIKVQVSYHLHLLSIVGFELKLVDKTHNENVIKISLREKLCFYGQFFKLGKSTQNLILTDHSHKINHNKGMDIRNNPYTDPFIEYFKKSKIEYTVFDFKSENSMIGFDLSNLKNVYSKRVKYSFNSSKVFQGQLNRLCIFLKKNYGKDFDLYQHLVNSIINNQVDFLTFYFILKKSKVKNILLYCYYNSTMMSIIRASNNLNINVVEYQHSQVTSNHFAYSNWPIDINNSKDFFPTKMWVWQESDAEYLAKQFRRIKDIDFIVGGNLMLESSKVKRDKKEDKYLRILVTLQGIGLPGFITNILEKYPNLIFYLRLHPRYPFDKELCEKLKLKYNYQIEIDQANSEPLYTLFNKVDYHLTCFSGSAIEATHFNLTNIIYGDKGYVAYKDKINNGDFLFIRNLKEFDCILKDRIKIKSDVISSRIDISQIFEDNFN